MLPTLTRLATFLIVVWTASAANGQISFDPITFNFDGPDVPPAWAPGVWPDGIREIRDDSYVIVPPDDFAGATSDLGLMHDDLIVETQVRFLDEGAREDYASVTVRSTDGNPDGYYGAVSSAGNLLMSRVTSNGTEDPVVVARATGFDAVNQDLKLRLVARGNLIELFAWPATDEIPDSPSLSLVDDLYAAGNEITIANSSFETALPAWPVAFRYVQVMPVPEPSANLMLVVAGIAALVRNAHQDLRR